MSLTASLSNYLEPWRNYLDWKELNKIALQLKSVEVVPEKTLILRSFEWINPDDVKVVMLFQDPYTQPNVATGIPCANNIRDESKWSPTLKILKDSVSLLHNSEEIYNFDPTLKNWTDQGVLLLNCALTAEPYKPGIHLALWRKFISQLLVNLSNRKTGIIYVLFGEEAKTFKPYIKEKFNFILQKKHPAYYVRIGKEMPCDVWKEINNILNNIYGQVISF